MREKNYRRFIHEWVWRHGKLLWWTLNVTGWSSYTCEIYVGFAHRHNKKKRMWWLTTNNNIYLSWEHAMRGERDSVLILSNKYCECVHKSCCELIKVWWEWISGEWNSIISGGVSRCNNINCCSTTWDFSNFSSHDATLHLAVNCFLTISHYRLSHVKMKLICLSLNGFLMSWIQTKR